jgi:hypothetical protein
MGSLKGRKSLIKLYFLIEDGKRRVTYISEITDMESDTILMHNIFEYVKSADSMDGQLERADGFAGIAGR